jgi:hypothetical protein
VKIAQDDDQLFVIDSRLGLELMMYDLSITPNFPPLSFL